jgi:hypothetical protein
MVVFRHPFLVFEVPVECGRSCSGTDWCEFLCLFLWWWLQMPLRLCANLCVRRVCVCACVSVCVCICVCLWGATSVALGVTLQARLPARWPMGSLVDLVGCRVFVSFVSFSCFATPIGLVVSLAFDHRNSVLDIAPVVACLWAVSHMRVSIG